MQIGINEIFFVVGCLIAIAILYVFATQYRRGQKIEQTLKKAGVKIVQPVIPTALMQWFILTVVSLTLAGFLFGYYAGTHGTPALNQEDVITALQYNIYLHSAYPGIDYKTIYYNSNTRKWVVMASNANYDIYVEYDDWLNEVSSVYATPITGDALMKATNTK